MLQYIHSGGDLMSGILFSIYFFLLLCGVYSLLHLDGAKYYKVVGIGLCNLSHGFHID